MIQSAFFRIITRAAFKGWFWVYFSYDHAQVVEPVLNLPKSEFPLAVLTRGSPAAVM